MPHKIVKYRMIKGTILCDTGLRIGGSAESIEIGGMDNPIIRHPITEEPYIPGSSLKGKMRSLLEYRDGRKTSQNLPKNGRDDNGEPCECGRCMVCKVFGPHKNMKHNLGPTRALFRDAKLCDDSRNWLINSQTEKGINFAEVKTENMINRKIGAAENPRTQERVPEGTEFNFEISVRIFDDDNEEEIVKFLEDGIQLLQQDYLGSSGSRGYGKVIIQYRVE